MGRARKPKRQKEIEGETRPSRQYTEPEFPVAVDSKPPFPLRGPVAVQQWEELVPILEAQRVLTRADLAMLAQAVNMMDMVQRSWESGAKPTAAEMTQLRMMYREFGLTPSSRSLAGQVDDDSDEDSDIFTGPKAVNG